MSVIEAASVNVKTMADDTLRLTVDIEPRFADAAFALFGKRGTPMALAALKAGADLVQEPAQRGSRPDPDPGKGGELSKWLAIRCGEVEFQQWLEATYPLEWNYAHGATAAQKAAGTVRALCGVESRAEIDNDEGAYERFHDRIREPWKKHNQGR